MTRRQISDEINPTPDQRPVDKARYRVRMMVNDHCTIQGPYEKFETADELCKDLRETSRALGTGDMIVKIVTEAELEPGTWFAVTKPVTPGCISKATATDRILTVIDKLLAWESGVFGGSEAECWDEARKLRDELRGE